MEPVTKIIFPGQSAFWISCTNLNSRDSPVLWTKYFQSFCADASNRVPIEYNCSSDRTRRVGSRFSPLTRKELFEIRKPEDALLTSKEPQHRNPIL